MEVQVVQNYKTTDERVFEDLHTAQLHQAALNFQAHYERNRLSTGESCVSGRDLVEWLTDNEDLVRLYFESVDGIRARINRKAATTSELDVNAGVGKSCVIETTGQQRNAD